MTVIETAIALNEAGLAVVPVKGKRPVGAAWQNTTVDDKPNGSFNDATGVGVVLGSELNGKFLHMLDVDVYDRKTSAELYEYICTLVGFRPNFRVGRAPKFAIPVLLEQASSKEISPSYVDEDGVGSRIEVLGVGQQAVFYGKHSESLEYAWFNGAKIKADFDAESIPELNSIQIKALFDKLDQYARSHGLIALADKIQSGNTSRASKVIKEVRNHQSGSTGIDKINAHYSIESLLGKYGYRSRGRVYQSPNTSDPENNFGFYIDDDGQRWYSFHTCDDIGREAASGACRFGDAFDLIAFHEYGNDRTRALSEALMIIDPEGVKREQREFMEAQQEAETFAGFEAIEVEVVTEDGESVTIKRDFADMAPEERIAVIKERHHAAQFIDYNLDGDEEADDYVLDGAITADGISVIAGSAGAGKTSALLPLAAKVAHLCKKSDPLRPLIRRNIIWITEDVKQAKRILKAMRLAGEFDGFTDADVSERIKLVQAHRSDPQKMVMVAEYYRTLVCPNESLAGTGVYYAPPWVVFDTFNANFDLDNENDNAEVGRLIALLKVGFEGIPVSIITHIAKALKNGRIGDMSARGAGAIEGDINQLLLLAKDESDKTWLEVGSTKHRFNSHIEGLQFEFVEKTVTTITRLGTEVNAYRGYSKATLVDRDTRAAIEAEKAFEDELAKEQEWDGIVENVWRKIAEMCAKETSVTKASVEAELAPKIAQNKVRNAFQKLESDGCIKSLSKEEAKELREQGHKSSRANSLILTKCPPADVNEVAEALCAKASSQVGTTR